MGDRELATSNLRPLARPPVLPTIDNRYIVQATLGSGGMANVVLARDQRLERLVAIKILHRDLASDPEHLERFRREALMLAMIESPYVVPVYDVVMSPSGGEQPFLVMRYVPGHTLAAEVGARQPFSPRRAATIVLQVLEGVRELHARRVVHRDLKLANVILGDDGRPILVDLGVAMDRKRSMLTRPGFVAGTVEAMAPEQKSGQTIDERVDIFQAGTILGQLACCRMMYDEVALAQAAPPMLASVVRAATAPIEQRYRSASEMMAALGVVVRMLGREA